MEAYLVVVVVVVTGVLAEQLSEYMTKCVYHYQSGLIMLLLLDFKLQLPNRQWHVVRLSRSERGERGEHEAFELADLNLGRIIYYQKNWPR